MRGSGADRDGPDKGQRLYKARGPDGEVAWVDHEALWRLQQGQVEELRRQHARRRRLALLALAGLVVLALVLVLLRWRIGIESPPNSVVEGSPAGAADAVAAADQAAGDTAAVSPSAPRAVADPRPPPNEQIAGAVRGWAGAWARQDLPAYLASYAEAFEPLAGLSRSDWESLRRRRLLSPAAIEVEIEQLEIELLEDGRAEARFLQSYSSPAYSDVVRKSLSLIEIEGEWRIVAEQAAAP